ncbi:SMI1/KNR4 family protein [Micromonospora sp. 15K316]|uniref:SMI1/KNR4 family protein n=1 Tax=Micromonospora sp. 15K316 TaxID=2530376 RepID=UPI00104BDA0F|nr:SMI1/KNR4 family protein [Micromonospora sp. 15K316]TDC30299.1 SMI1/KNR4 family protein [Micromonospora sp. 15K316]
MDIPVEESWRRIATWLARHAPVTAAAIRPSAGTAETRLTQEAIGRPLPDDLVAWWAVMDGIDDADYRAGSPIPPFYLPLPVAGVRERFADLSRFADQDCCGPGGAHATMAGETSFGFCTATVPICWALSGDVLVVDLRDGPRHGCMMQWMAEEGYDETGWSGTAAMLADVTVRLDDPTRTKIVDGGALQWS